MKVIIDDEEYLTLYEVMKLTGLKQTNLYIKVKYGEFPKPEYKKIRSLWKRSEIEKYMEKAKVE